MNLGAIRHRALAWRKFSVQGLGKFSVFGPGTFFYSFLFSFLFFVCGILILSFFVFFLNKFS